MGSVAAGGLLSCGMQTLSCGMHVGSGSLTRGGTQAHWKHKFNHCATREVPVTHILTQLKNSTWFLFIYSISLWNLSISLLSFYIFSFVSSVSVIACGTFL